MRTLTIRNVPDDVYEALQQVAERNRRSLQQQALTILERVRTLRGLSPLEHSRRIRERLADTPRDFGDTVEEIRAERER